MATVSVRRRPFSDFRLRSLARGNVLLTVVGLAALTGLSAYLRMRSFNAAFWIDEGLSVGIASTTRSRHPAACCARTARRRSTTCCCTSGWACSATGEAATHALSLIFALLAIPVALWAGASLFGRARRLVRAPSLLRAQPVPHARTRRRRGCTRCSRCSRCVTDGLLPACVRAPPARLPARASAVRWPLLLYTHNWGALLRRRRRWLAFAARSSRRATTGARSCATAPSPSAAPLLLYLPWLPTLLFQAAHTGAPWANAPRFGDLLQAPRSTARRRTRGAFVAAARAAAGLGAWCARASARAAASATRGARGCSPSSRDAARRLADLADLAGVGVALLRRRSSGPLLLIAARARRTRRRSASSRSALVVVFWLPFTAIARTRATCATSRARPAPALKPRRPRHRRPSRSRCRVRRLLTWRRARATPTRVRARQTGHAAHGLASTPSTRLKAHDAGEATS